MNHLFYEKIEKAIVCKLPIDDLINGHDDAIIFAECANKIIGDVNRKKLIRNVVYERINKITKKKDNKKLLKRLNIILRI